jgi:hypothetical protein
MKYTVRRTFLVRKVQTWSVETEADDLDIRHAVANHAGEFDVDLADGGDPIAGWSATQTSETEEPLDYNELHLEVMERGPGSVIPFRRRDA